MLSVVSRERNLLRLWQAGIHQDENFGGLHSREAVIGVRCT